MAATYRHSIPWADGVQHVAEGDGSSCPCEPSVEAVVTEADADPALFIVVHFARGVQP